MRNSGEQLKMQQKIDLETLQHILEQYSNDVLNDCPKIICKLLNSLNEYSSPDDFKIFTSVKVILYLYKKICMDNCSTELKLPVTLIIQTIKKIFLCHNGDNIHLDSKIQLEVISIIQTLFKISFLENSSEALDEFAKLYCFIMTGLSTADIAKECETDYVIFKLKILNTLYSLIENNTCEISKTEIFKKIKIENINEHEMYANLVLHCDDSIAIQTLMFLIPGYIDCFKTTTILEVIWKKISNSLSDSATNFPRVMLILYSFFDKYEKEEKTHWMRCLFKDVNYWELLQSVVVNNDPIIRKQGMYLFKKTVDVLNKTNETIMCSKENIIFYWDVNLKNELHKFYCDIMTILEFLDEQQVHIIRPIFKMAETLFEKIQKCNKVSLSWVFLIYHKALSHESTEVIKLGLADLLKLPKSFFEQECYAKEAVSLLIPVLNSLTIYYNCGMDVSNSLQKFLLEITTLKNAKVFFRFFIQEVCSLVWSPEALFFVVSAMDINNEKIKFPYWGENEISLIKSFVMKSFNTFHRTIRIAIQCKLLKAILTFTDVQNVSLQNIILLISNFPLMDSPHLQSKTWSELIQWLRESYSQEKFKEILDSYKRQELKEDCSDKFISIMFIIANWRSDVVNFGENEQIRPETESPLLEILILFKDIDKRLYCNKKIYDHYLSVISYFYKVNANSEVMTRNTIPLIKDVLLFIQNQLKQISSLQEFHNCQLYLNAFSSIIKAQNSFDIFLSKHIISLYEDILNDLKVCLLPESNVSPIGLYSRIKLLNCLIQTHPLEVKLDFLAPYLLTKVNKPLEKDNTYCEQTKDVQTLWGRMNSEFIEGKWKILNFLIKNNLVVHGNDRLKSHNAISGDDLVNLCGEGLSTGGYQVLCPVMSILKDILPVLNNFSQIKEIVTSVWKLLVEKKKSDEFKSFVKGFVEMLFQEKFIIKGENAEDILIEYTNLIFSNPSLAVVNIFMRHIQKIDLAGSSVSLFCHIIGKALIFGPVQRKDEKLTDTVCFYIDNLRICPVWDTQEEDEIRKCEGVTCQNSYSWPEKSGEHYTSKEVRGRAIERVLTLKKDSPRDQTIAKSLMETLIKLESEVGKKRYFGDSHIHRVKHRVMQSLLLLDHIHCLNKDESIKLLDWLWQSLMTENPQPSIRYQQEWLMSRILIKNTELYDRFNYLMESEKFKKKRGLCSYLSILLHFYRTLPSKLELLIDLSKFLRLLVHQHFEVRLYAQVIFIHLYNFAQSRNLTNIVNEWRTLHSELSYAYEEFLGKQFSKNVSKLSENFFFTRFDPLEHYSLDTIYKDLPGATNVCPEEWISIQMLKYCGVDPSKISISLETTAESLANHVTWRRTMDCDNEFEMGDPEIKETLENYQRKFIPTKPFTPNADEDSNCEISCERKDGLVVVASLIDRIPNLGGLARTCEIFGVSEYVLGSLKYTEDKQFTSLSVTAEKWIYVKEVKPQNLMEYILEKKQNGYTVVGAEQTLRSQSLSSVKFPKKTLLLLGNEKEGISPSLLPLLDICVEIPQMGIIRSLNVHVTGALFIWEYAKQKYFS